MNTPGMDRVLARMAEIDRELPPNDGVAWFNKLYRKTTESVRNALIEGRFEAPELLEDLDVEFAELFFAPYDLAATNKATDALPRAWAPLFEARTRKNIAPIQFALAGMNAHINHDLPFAVATVAAKHRFALSKDTPFWRDFLIVNDLLKTTEATVKVWFSTGFVGVIDEVLGDVDDRVALWSIVHARTTAWENAELLAGLPAHSPLRAPFASALDRLVGFAGRTLLLAADGERGTP